MELGFGYGENGVAAPLREKGRMWDCITRRRRRQTCRGKMELGFGLNRVEVDGWCGGFHKTAPVCAARLWKMQGISVI